MVLTLSVVCFAIGSYWFAIAAVKDIMKDFHLWCDEILIENDKKKNEWKEHLCDVIKDISDIKQLNSISHFE